MVLVSLVALAGLIGLFTLSGDTPDRAARDFMLGLATADAERLTNRTYLNSEGKSGQAKSTRDEMLKAWQTGLAGGKYYRFAYSVGEAQTQPDNSASVRLQVNRNPFGMGGYDEHFELPMFKEDGMWKVQVQGISREMFPFLPR